MALVCGPVKTLIRPCRRNARVYRPKDIRRIVRYIQGTHGDDEIIAAALAGMGLGPDVGAASEALQSVSGLLDKVAVVASAIATATDAILAGLSLIERMPWGRIPAVSAMIKGVKAVLEAGQLIATRDIERIKNFQRTRMRLNIIKSLMAAYGGDV